MIRRAIVLAFLLATMGCTQNSPEVFPEKFVPTQVDVDAENIADVPFSVYCGCLKGTIDLDKYTCEVNLKAMQYQPVGLVAAYEEHCK